MLAEALDRLPDGAGPIGLFSSDEFTPAARAFDSQLLALAGARVGLVLDADPSNAAANAARARDHFAGLGAVAEPVDLRAPEALPGFDLLYLAGGDPRALLERARDTPGWARALEAWRAGMGLAGSSAGAMALSEHCLVPEPGADKPTAWARGLGPLRRIGLAVHATTRPQQWLRNVAEISHLPVLAIDDATGVLLRARNEPVVIGHGSAWVVHPASSVRSQKHRGNP